MTTLNDDSRLGRLEGRVEEQSAAMQETRQDMRGGFQQVNARFDRMDSRELGSGHTDGQTDWLSLAAFGMVGVQFGLLIALVVQIV